MFGASGTHELVRRPRQPDQDVDWAPVSTGVQWWVSAQDERAIRLVGHFERHHWHWPQKWVAQGLPRSDLGS